MTVFTRDLAGAGAMLARLVDLGSRAGLSATQTLLHVLDGAPLPDPEQAPTSISDIVERVTGGNPPAPGPSCELPVAEAPIEAFPPRLRVQLLQGEATLPPEVQDALGAELKRDRVLNLYAITAFRRPRIAELAGTTLQGASFFLKEARAKSDPRIAAGDARRGGPPRAQAVLPAEQTDSHPAGQAEQTGAGAATAGGDDVTEPQVSTLSAETSGEPVRMGDEPDHPLGSSTEECAERDAGSSDLDGDVAAFPAPPAVQEDAPEKGTVSQPDTTLEAPPPADTADRPAGPGQELPETADSMVGGDPVAAAPSRAEETGDEGVVSESTLTGGESAAEEAGANPPAPASSPPRQNASAVIERLWRDTLLKQSEIGEQVGKTVAFVGAIISQKRKKRSPAILVGDAARLKADAERLKMVPPAAAAAAAPAEPAVAAPVGAPVPAKPRDPDQPDDLVLLKPGEILAIDRGWIVGPAGSLKGFPLIGAVLMTLAGGELFDATVVAKKCAVRSGDAVLAQLSHWKADLASIGVEVVRVGKADVRLRRA